MKFEHKIIDGEKVVVATGLALKNFPKQQQWLNAVNNGSTTLCQLFQGQDVIAEVRCLNGHKLEVLDAWDNFDRVKAERDELADAVRTLLNIEGPAKHGATFKAWHGLDVEWHFNKARAALAKLETKK